MVPEPQLQLAEAVPGRPRAAGVAKLVLLLPSLPLLQQAWLVLFLFLW